MRNAFGKCFNLIVLKTSGHVDFNISTYLKIALHFY